MTLSIHEEKERVLLKYLNHYIPTVVYKYGRILFKRARPSAL